MILDISWNLYSIRVTDLMQLMFLCGSTCRMKLWVEKSFPTFQHFYFKINVTFSFTVYTIVHTAIMPRNNQVHSSGIQVHSNSPVLAHGESINKDFFKDSEDQPSERKTVHQKRILPPLTSQPNEKRQTVIIKNTLSFRDLPLSPLPKSKKKTLQSKLLLSDLPLKPLSEEQRQTIQKKLLMAGPLSPLPQDNTQVVKNRLSLTVLPSIAKAPSTDTVRTSPSITRSLPSINRVLPSTNRVSSTFPVPIVAENRKIQLFMLALVVSVEACLPCEFYERIVDMLSLSRKSLVVRFPPDLLELVENLLYEQVEHWDQLRDDEMCHLLQLWK